MVPAHAIAVIVGKSMVIIVIAFTKGDQSNEIVVYCRKFLAKRMGAPGVG